MTGIFILYIKFSSHLSASDISPICNKPSRPVLHITDVGEYSHKMRC
jgi:hypothetical protein